MKIKSKNIYILCFTLILSFQFFLTGCAVNSFFGSRNVYNSGGYGGIKDGGRGCGYSGGTTFLYENGETDCNKKEERLKKELENRVLYDFLKLDKVSGKRMKGLERPEIYEHKDRAKNTGMNRFYIKPFFMKGEYNIDKRRKTKTYAKNIKNINIQIKPVKAILVKLNKTAEADSGKIALKINGVKYDGILEIISFSLSNFHGSPLRYKPLLFKKSAKEGKESKSKYIEIPFKSNIEKGDDKNYFILSGFSKIKGKIICMIKSEKHIGRSALHKTVLYIEALYKNTYGGIKFIKLPVRL